MHRFLALVLFAFSALPGVVHFDLVRTPQWHLDRGLTNLAVIDDYGRYVLRDLAGEIVLYDLINGTERTVGSGYGFALSGDANFFAYGRLLEAESSTFIPVLVDRRTGKQQVIARRTDGTPAPLVLGNLSGDGRFTVCTGPANALDPKAPSEGAGLFLFDRSSGVTRRLHQSSNGIADARISANGRVIIFVENINPRLGDVSLRIYDIATGSVTYPGEKDMSIADPSIDGTGRRVVFTTWTPLMSSDTNARRDVYCYDRQQGSFQRISSRSGGTFGSQSISYDGRYVAYTLDQDGGAAGDDNQVPDIFIRDLVSGQQTRRSLKPDGSQSRYTAFNAILAPRDARKLLFSVQIARTGQAPDADWPSGALVFTDYSWRSFHVKINFQPSGSPHPAAHLVDGGEAFGNRAWGYAFGWSATNTVNSRDRQNRLSADQRYDTLIHMQSRGEAPRSWELAVPNGRYIVRVVAGDPSYLDGRMQIGAEETTVIDFTPTASARWMDRTVTLEVIDGRLTLHNLPDAVANKLCFVEVSSTSAP